MTLQGKNTGGNQPPNNPTPSGPGSQRTQDEEVIDVAAVVERTNRIIREANPGAIAQAKKVKVIYIIGVIFIFGVIAIAIPFPYGFGIVLSGLIISIASTLAKGLQSVGSYQMVFIQFLNTATKAKGPGLAFCFWPLERFHPMGVNLGYRDIEFETTIELRRTKKAPRNWVKIKKGLIVGRVVNPFKYIYQMPGDSIDAKRLVITQKVEDEMQTYINRAKMSEDEVMTLSGQELAENLKDKVENILRNVYGFSLKDITLGKPERSAQTEDLVKKEYTGVAEGERQKREMASLARILFGVEDDTNLTVAQRKDLKDFYLSIKTIESVGKTDKTIFGGPDEIKKRVTTQQIAEEIAE